MKIKDKELLKACRADFLQWLENDSYIDDYADVTFPEGKILLRVYLYTPPVEKKSNIIGLDNKSLSAKFREVLLPYAKVIKVGGSTSEFYSSLSPGDIVSIPDDLVEFEKNPQYEFYKEALKERPAPEVEMPPMFIGKISRWFPYQFILDKITHAFDEEVMDMTFLVPQTNVLSKIEPKFFNRYEINEVIKDKRLTVAK